METHHHDGFAIGNLIAEYTGRSGGKAEVMYSAPPEYHVRGAAINVVMKKATDHSFSGEVSADYRNQYFNDGNANANFRYTTPKLAVDVMYGTANDKKMTKIDLYSRHTLQGQVHDIRNEEEIREKDGYIISVEPSNITWMTRTGWMYLTSAVILRRIKEIPIQPETSRKAC